MSSSSNRRRALAVDAQVRRFYLAVVAFGVLEVALLGALGILLRRAGHSLFAGTSGWLLAAVCGTALAAALLALALAAYVTVQTHRMVGSAMRIEQAVKDFRQSRRHSPVVLRPSDYLQEIAEELNGLAGDLQEAPLAGARGPGKVRA